MKTVLILGATLTVLLCIVWTQQRKLMYFPLGQVPDPRGIGLKGTSAVTFPTRDGLTLNGWFVVPAVAARYTVIVFNGNAGNRAHRAPLARELVDNGFAVLLFDYRGFGGNSGTPTEAGLAEDARAVREYVLRRPDVDPQRLVYFGESLGSAVAAALAVDHPPSFLVLRSPFTSMTDLGRLHYPFLPVSWLLRDRFATIDIIARVRAPVLVIAGDRDRIVPIGQSRQVYEAASGAKSMLVLPGADHNDDVLNSGREMVEGILRFLKAT